MTCQHCGKQVWICRRCDQGKRRRYCSEACSRQARRDSIRRAGRRFRRTKAGRMGNARRQRCHYQRKKRKGVEPVPQIQTQDAGDEEQIAATVGGESQEPLTARKNLTHHLAYPEPSSGMLTSGGSQGPLRSRGQLSHHSAVRPFAEVSSKDTSARASCTRCHFCGCVLSLSPDLERSTE